MNHYSTILGAAIGDISGSVHESSRRAIYRTNYKFFTQQSSITDDTILTMAVADWLLHKDRLPIADALRKWGRAFPDGGYGRGFKTFMRTGSSGQATTNGAAMRVGPVGAWATSVDEALALAAEQAAPTHAAGGAEAAQAIAAAVFLAKDGFAGGREVAAVKAGIRFFISARFGYDLGLSAEEIRLRSQETARMKAEMKATGIAPVDYVRASDGARTAANAITAVLLANSYESAVRLAVSFGGDADTVAAMAGAIAAQLWGIPEELIRSALVYLPAEMISLINAFDGSAWQPTGITPPRISHWTKSECVVYGAAPEGQSGEEGWFDTVVSARNHHAFPGYPIPTVGKSLAEIKAGVDAFLAHAQAHPQTRFHVHKLGYHKAGYTVAQIAPLFREALAVPNVLLPAEVVEALSAS